MFALDKKYYDLLLDITGKIRALLCQLPKRSTLEETALSNINIARDQLFLSDNVIEIKAMPKSALYDALCGYENEDFIDDKELYRELLEELSTQ